MELTPIHRKSRKKNAFAFLAPETALKVRHKSKLRVTAAQQLLNGHLGCRSGIMNHAESVLLHT